MHAVQVEHLSKTYANGTEALKNISLEIASGDFFALLGANGAGKTTMIGIITGLVNKTAGRARIFNIDIDENFSEAKRYIGVVPQEFNFSIFERVEDILLTQAGYFGIPRSHATHEVTDLLKRVGLWNKRTHSARSLSGGMKRRLMIARALVHRPKLLILDEPTAGVDVELRHGMWDYLRDINQQGMTILLTTHYLEEVEQMCRNAAIIKNGEIVAHDRVSRLMQLSKEDRYVIVVNDMKGTDALKKYQPSLIDHNTFEITLPDGVFLHDCMDDLKRLGMTVADVRPKGHRLEKLFLNILKS